MSLLHRIGRFLRPAPSRSNAKQWSHSKPYECYLLAGTILACGRAAADPAPDWVFDIEPGTWATIGKTVGSRASIDTNASTNRRSRSTLLELTASETGGYSPDSLGYASPRNQITVSLPMLRIAVVVKALCLGGMAVMPVFYSLHWVLELPAHFRLHIAAVSAILAIFAVARKQYVASLLAVSALALASKAMISVPVAREVDASGLVVVSQNLAAWNSHAEAAVPVLEGQAADILVLQEYNGQWHDALADFTRVFPYAVTLLRDGYFGIAVFSRHRITDHRILNLAESNIPFIDLRIESTDFTGRLIAVHFSAPITRRRSGLRNRQLDELKEHLASVEEPYLVIGDFNNTPFSPTLSRFLDDTRTSVGPPGLDATWPAVLGSAGIPIDLAIGSENVLFSGGSTFALAGTDHRGIRVMASTRSSARE